MKHYTRCLMAAICLGVLLSGYAHSQDKREPFKLFNKSDAVYWAGASLDAISSLNKHEANPLFRDSRNLFSPGRNLGVKASIWGAFKVLEWRYDKPGERKALRWVKFASGFAWGFLAVRNFRIKPAN